MGMRPSRGMSMDSYRAKCSGCLSILRFFIRLAEYTAGRYEPRRGTIGTDSQSMLDTVALKPREDHDHVQHSFLKPLEINVPEWDLLQEIRESLLQLPGISLTYVNAHQDDHTSYEQLPLQAQLNVDADHQASKYQTQFGAHRMSVLLSPNARMLVHSLEGTITGRFETILRVRSTKPAIKNTSKTAITGQNKL